jgi:hypothetical protein
VREQEKERERLITRIRARGAELGGFAGGGLQGVLGSEGVLGFHGFINAAGKLDGRYLQKSFIILIFPPFKSKCPEYTSCFKFLYADFPEFVAIRDWVSIFTTMWH